MKDPKFSVVLQNHQDKKWYYGGLLTDDLELAKFEAVMNTRDSAYELKYGVRDNESKTIIFETKGTD